MWMNTPETHGEGIWAVAGAIVAHLLAVLHERSMKAQQQQDRADRLCTLIHTEVQGLLESFRDKRFYIETHWQDSLKENTSVYEATAIKTDSLDRLYTEVVILPEDTVRLFSLVLRRIKTFINEFEEKGEFPSNKVRSKLALRVYNLCIVEKTLHALDRRLKFDQSLYRYRQERFYKRWLGLAKKPHHATLQSVCDLCGRSGFSIGKLIDCDNPHLVLPGHTTMRPASEIHCASPLLVQIRERNDICIPTLAGKMSEE